MQAVRVEDILPKEPEFTLRKRGKVYRLRPPTLGDRQWFTEQFQTEAEVSRIFNQHDWPKISKIVYKLLSDEDRRDFLAREVTAINDDGREETVWITGAEHLLTQIASIDEGIAIIAALNSAFAASSVEVGKAIKEEVKKNLRALQTGPQSSTASRMSTDGRPNTSSRARSGRSTTGSGRSKKGRIKN